MREKRHKTYPLHVFLCVMLGLTNQFCWGKTKVKSEKLKLSAHKTIFHLFNLDKNANGLNLRVSMVLSGHRLQCWQWVWWYCAKHGSLLFWLCPTQSVTCLCGLALVPSMWHMDYYYFKQDRDRRGLAKTWNCTLCLISMGWCQLWDVYEMCSCWICNGIWFSMLIFFF